MKSKNKTKEPQLSNNEKLKAALVPEDEQPYPIPENWMWTRVTALAKQIRGISYSKSDASGQPDEKNILVLRAGNIQDGEFQITEDCVYVPDAYASEAQMLQLGDIVVVGSSGSKSVVGKAAQVSTQMPDTSFGAFLTLFRPDSSINAKYYGWFFQSRHYRDEISEASISININNLRREHFESLAFPLPPLPEQQRIAEKLESLLGKIKEAKALLDEIPDILYNFRQTVLAAACSGRLTADWRKKNQNIVGATGSVARSGRGTASPLQNELPETWVASRFDQVFDINPGHKNIPIDNNLNISFVPMNLIEEETGKINTNISKKYKEVKNGYTKFIENRCVPPGSPGPSIGTLVPSEIPALRCDYYKDPPRLRMRIVDHGGTIKDNVPITDLAFRGLFDFVLEKYKGDCEKTVKLLNKKLEGGNIYLRLGLSRSFRGCCWLQVNGIHAFPDLFDRDYVEWIRLD